MTLWINNYIFINIINYNLNLLNVITASTMYNVNYTAYNIYYLSEKKQKLKMKNVYVVDVLVSLLIL